MRITLLHVGGRTRPRSPMCPRWKASPGTTRCAAGRWRKASCRRAADREADLDRDDHQRPRGIPGRAAREHHRTGATAGQVPGFGHVVVKSTGGMCRSCARGPCWSTPCNKRINLLIIRGNHPTPSDPTVDLLLTEYERTERAVPVRASSGTLFERIERQRGRPGFRNTRTCFRIFVCRARPPPPFSSGQVRRRSDDLQLQAPSIPLFS